jgi:hypothetical protein
MIYYILLIYILIFLYYIFSFKKKEYYINSEPKIIILIIASNNINEYNDMHKIWKKYMNKHPNIQSFFIKNEKLLDKDIVLDIKNNTIYCKYNENFIPGILNKTIKSIEYCLNNFEFDYIYRTNLSSVLNLDKLYSYVKNNNNINYAGKIYGNFISGSGFLLSKDACKKLVIDKSLIDNNIIDDVAIGNALTKYYEMINIEFYHISGVNDKIFDNNNFENINNIIFQFRCRFATEHTNTALVMSKIYKKIYKKK